MTDLNLALAVPAELNPNGITVRVMGNQEEPLFHAEGVCAVLGMTGVNAVRQIVERLDEDEVSFHYNVVETPREGRPSTYDKAYVTESGFYKIVLTSRAENAKPFRNWVCREVLPCIRKHGCYPAPANQAPPSDLGSTLSLILQHIQCQPLQIVQRPMNLIDPREFTLRCWPDVSDRTLQNVVRRMDNLYRSMVGRPAPQDGTDPRGRLMCEPEHLPCLMQAIGFSVHGKSDSLITLRRIIMASIRSDISVSIPSTSGHIFRRVRRVGPVGANLCRVLRGTPLWPVTPTMRSI